MSVLLLLIGSINRIENIMLYHGLVAHVWHTCHTCATKMFEPINRLFRAPVEIGFGDSDRSRSSDSEHALMSLRSLVVLEKSSRQNLMPNWDCFEKWNNNNIKNINIIL